MQYHYVPGETRMSDKGREFTDLPSTINHHWTKELLASRDGRKLYVGVGSNSNITENGLAVEYRRAVVLEVDVATRGSRIFASGSRAWAWLCRKTGNKKPRQGGVFRLQVSADQRSAPTMMPISSPCGWRAC